MHADAAAVGVIIVAAGSGSRLGASVPKAFVPLADVPLLGHALRGALACPQVGEVVVVAPPGWVDAAREITEAVCRGAGPQPMPREPGTQSSVRTVHRAAAPPESSVRTVHRSVVPGGEERGDSVAAGLAALSPAVGIVLVHDAARCLTPVEVFERVIAAVRRGAGAVVPGLAVVDTIKAIDPSGHVVGTPDRATLRAVQTPQGFRRDLLERAHASSSDATDDAALVERLGEQVLVVDGDPRALKVTTTADLEAAARILAG